MVIFSVNNIMLNNSTLYDKNESGIQRKTWKRSQDYTDDEFPRKCKSSPIDLALSGNPGKKHWKLGLN